MYKVNSKPPTKFNEMCFTMLAIFPLRFTVLDLPSDDTNLTYEYVFKLQSTHDVCSQSSLLYCRGFK